MIHEQEHCSNVWRENEKKSIFNETKNRSHLRSKRNADLTSSKQKKIPTSRSKIKCFQQ